MLVIKSVLESLGSITCNWFQKLAFVSLLLTIKINMEFIARLVDPGFNQSPKGQKIHEEQGFLILR